MDRVHVAGLDVAGELYRFIEVEALPGSGVDPDTFWAGAQRLIEELGPRNREFLATRQRIQAAIDEYHCGSAVAGTAVGDGYEDFLRSIDYVVDPPESFCITTASVDPEINRQAGPQLVVPLLNARFAVNAANARWGSLYDALYGSDVIDEVDGRARGGDYNPVRGAAVVARARDVLDSYFPLRRGTHSEVIAYGVGAEGLLVELADGETRLADPAQFVGFCGDTDAPDSVVLVHHGLHVEIRLDRSDPVGAADLAGVKDVVLEAALTTIMDLEDSVAAVDAGDKVLGYRNWLLLMQGLLAEEVTKNGRTFVRSMVPDRELKTVTGDTRILPGRALLLIRHTGLLMTTDAVLDADGHEVPEGILDALVTVLGSCHDLRGNTTRQNSRAGSAYVVKPKLHGPAEVAFACEVLSRVEQLLDLPPLTVKIGIMDEERRTSANLAACIHAARDRVAFINTGFLDRTGDEIHTSMVAGPMVRKAEMRDSAWIQAYEENNVTVGLACGLLGRAQIGKGMWAAPDNMAEMLESKIAQPRAGANCAWVPSPTAATLHGLHYHEVDVAARQQEIVDEKRPLRDGLLTPPIADATRWSAEMRQAELDNNAQGILGYVVRWVDDGVGCSKVPDIHGVALMEDRATCRISSQLIANWLLHSVITADEVEQSLRRMAEVVDGQNGEDPNYRPMAPDFDGPAFLAARRLVFEGTRSPSGYTEPVLHVQRAIAKLDRSMS